MRQLHVLFFYWLCLQTCFAQHDTLLQLNPVDITANRFRIFDNASNLQRVDSIALLKYSNNSLGNLLNDESNVFVKSYGTGSSATAGARGSGAAHTSILWNGFSLNNAMLGLGDLSLLPVSFFNDINIRYGNNCALAGSGSIGAAVELNNKPTFKKELSSSATFTFGSFSSYKEHISLRSSNHWNSASLVLFNENSKNNFEFGNRAEFGKPIQKQKNNEVKQYGLMINQTFMLNPKNILLINGWYQNSNREIPASMTAGNSAAYQTDNALRVTTEWQRFFKKNFLKWRSAWFNESIRYVDSLINLDSYGNVKTLVTEAEFDFNFERKGRINAGINNSYFAAFADEYEHTQYQNKLASFATYHVGAFNNKLNTQAALRQEIIDGEIMPFTFQLQSSIILHQKLKLHASFASVYRAPSFNDLHWIPGGNKDLNSEQGYVAEAGLNYNKHAGRWLIDFSTAFYTQQITNWIIWLPSNGGYWTPQNIYHVWSRGNESRLKASFNYSKWNFTPQLVSAYTLSTNQTENAGENIYGKQLIYVPEFTGGGGFSVSYNKSLISYSHNFKSTRYTSSDNVNYLEPYYTGRLYLSHIQNFKKNSVTLSFSIHNLWNQTFESIEWRPMPLRHFEFSIKYQFINNK